MFDGTGSDINECVVDMGELGTMPTANITATCGFITMAVNGLGHIAILEATFVFLFLHYVYLTLNYRIMS